MNERLFDDFDFSLLDNSDFKEDSVREEIIAPILKKLGYSASSSQNKIIRSKGLKHPFVYIGTKKHGINIIPDYLLTNNGKNIFILDAKAPNEDIKSGKNVEQAYSYAIHPEVRVPFYGLCNGREISIFHINDLSPKIVIPIKDIDKRWEELYNAISPLALTDPDLLGFMPDLGIALRQTGFNKNDLDFLFTCTAFNFVAKLDESNYTLSTSQRDNGIDYIIQLDFSKDLFESFISSIPTEMQSEIRTGLSRNPFTVYLPDEDFIEISVSARLGNEVYSNQFEQYIPFIVQSFSPCKA